RDAEAAGPAQPTPFVVEAHGVDAPGLLAKGRSQGRAVVETMQPDITGRLQPCVKTVTDREELTFRVERQAQDRDPGHRPAPDRLAAGRIPDLHPALGLRIVEAPSGGDKLGVGPDPHGPRGAARA